MGLVRRRGADQRRRWVRWGSTLRADPATGTARRAVAAVVVVAAVVAGPGGDGDLHPCLHHHLLLFSCRGPSGVAVVVAVVAAVVAVV